MTRSLADIAECMCLRWRRVSCRLCSQLKMLAPTHPYSVRYEAGEDLFSKAAAAMA